MEGNKKWIMIFVNAALVVLCLALVIVGQRNVSVSGLGLQLLGLAGILLLLYLYNRKYQ